MQRYFDVLKRRNILLLIVSSVNLSFFHGFLHWFLPMQLVIRGGAALAGVALAVANIDDVVCSFIGGLLADRYGRKTVILPSTLLYPIGSVFLLLSFGHDGLLWIFAAIVIFLGVTSISHGPISAMVAESVGEKSLGTAFSLFLILSCIARSFGSLFFGAISEDEILASSIILLLSIACFTTMLFLRETLVRGEREPIKFPLTLRAIGLSITQLTTLALFIVFHGLAHGVSGYYYPPYLNEQLRLDEEAIGLVYAILPISYMILQPIAGYVTDKYGVLGPLIVGNAISGVFLLAFCFSPIATIAVVLMVISASLGTFHAAGYGALVAKLSSRGRATLYGGLGSVWSTMFIVGPVVGGLLYGADRVLPFLVASVLFMLTVPFVRALAREARAQNL